MKKIRGYKYQQQQQQQHEHHKKITLCFGRKVWNGVRVYIIL